MAEKNTLKDLLTDEIKDLYSAEKQLTKALPKMAKGANDPLLKEALKAHLAETQDQVDEAIVEDAPRPMSPLPPGVGEVDVDGVDRIRRQHFLKCPEDVAAEDADRLCG